MNIKLIAYNNSSNNYCETVNLLGYLHYIDQYTYHLDNKRSNRIPIE